MLIACLKTIRPRSTPILLSVSRFSNMSSVMDTVRQKLSSSESSQRYAVPDLKASELKKGSKQEVTLGQHKVLLVKSWDGTLSALSPKCTHYGAPLKNGVLTSDNRLTCPWHGACFNAKTGDIEDAPALDSLNAFPVEVDGETIYISAVEEDLKAFSRDPCKGFTSSSTQPGGKGTVIVGGGAAGLACSEALRQGGYKESITILTKEPNLPIDRTKLSKAYITDASKILLRTPEQLKQLSVEVKQVGAKKVDKANKKVELEDGSSISYDKLVLACGAYPSDLPIEGFELEGVFKLRNLVHTQAITKALGEDKSKHLVILGGSFIGLESAMGLLQKAASITIIEPAYPLKKVLGDKVSQRLVKWHEEKGVKFIIGQGSVKTIKASSSDSKKVGSVLLENGDTLNADAVLVAIGVKPDTAWLKNDFNLMKDGGLEIGSDCKIKGEQDVYATGDIASFDHPGVPNSSGRIEHWNVAENLGRTAGFAIAGQASPYNKPPVFWSAQQGKQLRYSGHAEDFDDVVIQGSLEDLKFSAFYTKGDKVLAVATIMTDPVCLQASELMRSGKMLSASDIRAGKSVLDVNP